VKSIRLGVIKNCRAGGHKVLSGNGFTVLGFLAESDTRRYLASANSPKREPVRRWLRQDSGCLVIGSVKYKSI